MYSVRQYCVDLAHKNVCADVFCASYIQCRRRHIGLAQIYAILSDKGGGRVMLNRANNQHHPPSLYMPNRKQTARRWATAESAAQGARRRCSVNSSSCAYPPLSFANELKWKDNSVYREIRGVRAPLSGIDDLFILLFALYETYTIPKR